MTANDNANNETKLQIPILQYFWQASILSPSRKNSINRFLRDIKIFDNFSEYELWRFATFLHVRKYSKGEIIFKEGDRAYAFFFILQGHVDIVIKKTLHSDDEENDLKVVRLNKCDYMGELALLENENTRNATAISYDNVVLLAIYKPDIEELTIRYPVIAAKFIQTLASIVARRFHAVASELQALKAKIVIQESKNER